MSRLESGMSWLRLLRGPEIAGKIGMADLQVQGGGQDGGRAYG